MPTVQRGDPSAKKAARWVLTGQFATLRERLLLVFETPTEAERIHKLRVTTRRATAALDAFAVCLPRRAYKHARQVFRTLRRTAGSARDWDVFFPAVSAWASGQPEHVRPFADALLGWSASKRDSAQAALITLAGTYPTALDAVTTDTLAALHRPKERLSVEELGRRRVTRLQTELAEACDREPTTDAEYHQVRIAGKRLRYAAELFAEHIPNAERIDADMRALQEVLGRHNDGVVGANHLGDFARHFEQFHPAEWERLKPGADALGEHFATVREAEKVGFRDWRANRPA